MGLNSKSPKPKRPRRHATARQAEAGARNLAEYMARTDQPPARKHGLHSLLATGALPPGKEELAEKVDAVIGQMESDLGGASELGAQQRAILESQRMCLLVLTLSNNYVRAEGLMNERRKLHPLLATVVSFANCLRLNALALGLARKTKNATPSLAAYLREREEKQQTEGAAQ